MLTNSYYFENGYKMARKELIAHKTLLRPSGHSHYEMNLAWHRLNQIGE